MRPRFGIYAIMRNLLRAAVVSAAFAVVAGAAAARAADDPMEVVKVVVNQALEVLRDQRGPLHDRQEKLRRIVDAHFDFTTMSRSALGYHWRDLDAGQRADFTRTFTSFIQDSYLSKIQDYSGEQVDFGRATQPDPGYAQVMAKILQPGKQSVPISYMLKQRGGQWLIYDVTVDEISIIANYRNQFNRVINRNGFASLMADLKNKQRQLAADLGTPHAHD